MTNQCKEISKICTSTVPILTVGLRRSCTTTCKQEESGCLKNGKLLNRPCQVCDKFIKLEYLENPDAMMIMMWKCY